MSGVSPVSLYIQVQLSALAVREYILDLHTNPKPQVFSEPNAFPRAYVLYSW